MEYIVDGNQMKNIDKTMIEEIGVPSVVLMERAAYEVAAEIEKRADKKDRILVLCGSGNNGGDGIAVGRILFLAGFQVKLLFRGKEEKATCETKMQLGIVKKLGMEISGKEDNYELYDIIVDALFGIGLSKNIEGENAEEIEKIN
jgi:hydroxyethylthiazole kinase-like uncharacterized protein yjeF